MPGAAAELGLADLMTMARTKLMAALPAGARVERVATRFHLDAAGWFRATDSVTALPLIAGAVWNARFLRFRYGQVNDVGVRKVGPVGLVLKAGIWYLVAQKGDAFRTYRVSRISKAEVLYESYARPQLSRPYDDSPVASWPLAHRTAGPVRRGSGCEDGWQARQAGMDALHDPAGIV